MKIVNKNFVVQDFVRKRKRTLPYNVYITHYVLDCSYIPSSRSLILWISVFSITSPSADFGLLRESSEMIVSFAKIPELPG